MVECRDTTPSRRLLAYLKLADCSDLGKRLLDYGFHAPTVYFPPIVKESMMIEPTETESKETIDGFIEAMIDIAKQAETDPDSFKDLPKTTPVGRLDETKAAKLLDLAF